MVFTVVSRFPSSEDGAAPVLFTAVSLSVMVAIECVRETYNSFERTKEESRAKRGYEKRQRRKQIKGKVSSFDVSMQAV